jgi:hypothetical protein
MFQALLNPGSQMIPMSPTVLAYIYIVTGLQAVGFTFNLVRKLPRKASGARDWKQILRDEYLQSDLYGALLGWVGLLVVWYVSGGFD